MKTKREYQELIASAISSYPTAAQLYRAQDPILLAQLDAIATMFAMVSAEQDIATFEPFTKARDMTVLADASAKGILPFGTPAKVKVLIQNKNDAPVTILSGRRMLDTVGRAYVVDIGATIAANDSAEVTATQSDYFEYQHEVTISQPFYKIPVQKPDNLISSVTLSLGATPFTQVQRFVNVTDGEQVFHLESDENRTVNIVLGIDGVAGYQPAASEEFTVRVHTTDGYFELALGSLFSFDTASLYDGNLLLSLSEFVAVGANPMDINTMREVCSYPSIYDTSAVYLANFDFLIRRNLQDMRFLSVWNEQKEEEIRGANIDNINKLFVSALKDGILTGALESQISLLIREADDSYRIQFITPVIQEITTDITITLAAIYDPAAIENAIQEIVLDNYGPDSAFAKRGLGRVNKKRLTKLLEAGIPALQDTQSDIDIIITDPAINILPENYRYISTGSLTITVESA